jgi:hypothetical protein
MQFQGQKVAMLRILIAACETARNAFQAADNRVDDELLADLERVIERSRVELQALTTGSTPSS